MYVCGIYLLFKCIIQYKTELCKTHPSIMYPLMQECRGEEPTRANAVLYHTNTTDKTNIHHRAVAIPEEEGNITLFIRNTTRGTFTKIRTCIVVFLLKFIPQRTPCEPRICCVQHARRNVLTHDKL